MGETNDRCHSCINKKINAGYIFLIFIVQIILIGIYYHSVVHIKTSVALRESRESFVNVLKSRRFQAIFNKLEGTITNLTHTNITNNSTLKETTFVETLKNCSEYPAGLKGRVDISFKEPPPTFQDIELLNKLILDGGRFSPPNCKPKWKVAILVPYRNREEHLRYFLYFMHPVLQRQEIYYRVYVINQAGGEKFNRAKLLNVGFEESLKDENFDCFLFHDVDHILINDNALYTCPASPRHMSHSVDKYNWGLPYSAMFGGVSQLTKEQFKLANGFANSYWGWGAEDDDLYTRIHTKGMNVIRYPKDIGVYMMIPHKRDRGNEVNPIKDAKLKQTRGTMDKDGLTTLKYSVLYKELHKLYTNVTVDIGICGNECTDPRARA